MKYVTMKRNKTARSTRSGRYAKGSYPARSIKLLTFWGIAFSIGWGIASATRVATDTLETVVAKEETPEEIVATPTPEPETAVVVVEESEPVYVDERAEKLGKYLKKKGSPLAAHANYIIEQSDRNGIDWTLIVAIANKESTLCKHIKPGSHNCWGLGGRNFMYFDSYEAAIKYEAELLNRAYREVANRGIQQKYCPDYECASNWVQTVSNTSREILEVE